MEKFISSLGRTFKIAENQYGNWYGYIGGKKVETFLGEQKGQAEDWLKEQKRIYGEKKS